MRCEIAWVSRKRRRAGALRDSVRMGLFLDFCHSFRIDRVRLLNSRMRRNSSFGIMERACIRICIGVFIEDCSVSIKYLKNIWFVLT